MSTTDRADGTGLPDPGRTPPAPPPAVSAGPAAARPGAWGRRTARRAGPRRRPLWPEALALLLAAVFVFPVYWMFATSFKSNSQVLTRDPVLWFTPTFEHYATATGVELFWVYVRNSVTVTLGAVLLALLVALAASFALARLDFRGRRGMVLVVMAAQMAPWEILIIVMYLNARDLRMLNSLLTLTVVYFVMALPFTVWMLRGFIAAVPRELEESAMIDGCGRGGAFFRVIFPLLAPGLMATSLFGFIMAWNEYAMVLVLNKAPQAATLPLWLTRFQTNFGNDWGATMAASSMFTVPVLLVFLILQRRVTGGMAAGAVKG
ncbi:carbohydrate ABC transporter permease [Streptomyces sodiiphilus]|uniref:Carbohydrate ABC transporter permease n=1 Tax=Streptomyces sodiiphilus TaxID=226217 RepID=A0ABN2NSZ8_9ACTN